MAVTRRHGIRPIFAGLARFADSLLNPGAIEPLGTRQTASGRPCGPAGSAASGRLDPCSCRWWLRMIHDIVPVLFLRRYYEIRIDLSSSSAYNVTCVNVMRSATHG